MSIMSCESLRFPGTRTVKCQDTGSVDRVDFSQMTGTRSGYLRMSLKHAKTSKCHAKEEIAESTRRQEKTGSQLEKCRSSYSSESQF